MRGLLIAVLLAGTFIAGCDVLSNDCSQGEQRCEDGAVLVCQEHCLSGGTCRTIWQRFPCADEQVCVEPSEDYALCAAAKQPTPGCPAAAVVYCSDDDEVISCTSGFATSVLDCAASGLACVDEVSWVCVESETRHDRCNGDASHYLEMVCEGDFLIECMGGYVTRSHACAGHCQEREGVTFAECVLPNSEELCPQTATDYVYEPRCAGDTAYYCDQGVAFEIQDCSLDDQVCVEHDPAASGLITGCEDPTAMSP